MSAYIVADCEVTDPIRYEKYKKLAQAAVAKHGGRYIVRGGNTSCSRENGNRTASSCSSFRARARCVASTRRPNIAARARSAKAPRG